MVPLITLVLHEISDVRRKKPLVVQKYFNKIKDKLIKIKIRFLIILTEIIG